MSVTSPFCWPVIPYWLFSTKKMTGRPCSNWAMVAKFIDSWAIPLFMAPSPTQQTTTRFCSSRSTARAAPVAIAMLPPTIAFAPRLPTLKSAMCIPPPLPLQYPASLPSSSAIVR